MPKGEAVYKCLDCNSTTIVRLQFQREPVKCLMCGGLNLKPVETEEADELVDQIRV